MKVISLVNQKGGVSKTTSTHNLGSALSQLGKKVLLIDLDPQGNLTSGVGIDKSEIKNCIYDLLIEDTVELEETIVSLEEFDIVPATIKLAIADSKLINEYARERKLLDKIENTDYDYVLIDCPPSLTILTINALVASDYVLIPVKMEKYAFDGIIHLGNTINSIKNSFVEEFSPSHVKIMEETINFKSGIKYKKYSSMAKFVVEVYLIVKKKNTEITMEDFGSVLKIFEEYEDNYVHAIYNTSENIGGYMLK